MNKETDTILTFIFSFGLMVFGIFFFIGLPLVFEINFTSSVVIMIFGWLTVQSFLAITNLFIERIREWRK